jgi:LuxR family transcriptional regulator, maltose regulon positive regulatory protein
MTDTFASSYILTKLRIPAIQPRSIPRPQLTELLTRESGRGFVLVSAPAGYGKTSLLSEWARFLVNHGTAVAWYAIDPGDDAAATFGAYLVAGLIQTLGITPELERAGQLLRSSAEVDLQVILPAVINTITLSESKTVLILDDYHLVSSPAIHTAVAFLLEHLPENMCIALGSRSDPPLPLARLRARGQMFEMRAADLRFTASETARFLNEVMQLDLAPEMVGALGARSEGWAAGLQLAALSLAGREDKESFLASFGGSHRYLVEYLLEEVVNRQPGEVSVFLLETSILERMCAPLCDAILGLDAQSEAILEQIERLNLFVVRLDDQAYWYRYHHLFRDFLQTHLQKTQSDRLSALHRAACEWLAPQGFLREAARHAFQTQDWEYVAAFVEEHTFTMIVHSDIATIYEWCAAFPEEVLRKHPLLNIQYCLALAYSFRRQNREKVEARLGEVDRIIAELENRQLAGELFELAAVVRTFLAMAPDATADAQELLDLTKVILDHYPEGNPGQFSGLLLTGYAHLALLDVSAAEQVLNTARQIALRERLYFGYVEASFHLARLAHTQGNLSRAADFCRQSRAEMEGLLEHAAQELPALGCLDIAQGCVLLEQNKLDEADRYLLQGLQQIGWKMNPYYLLTALVALARLREVQGRLKEANEYLTRLEETWPDTAFCTSALNILIALRAEPDDPQASARASAWLSKYSDLQDEGLPMPGIGPYGATEAFYWTDLASIRFQIATGEARTALSKIERRLDNAISHNLSTRVIELSLLEALAAAAEGDEGRSLGAIERALELGEAESYLRIFDQGLDLTRLLVQASRRSKHHRYLEKILDAVGRPESALPADHGPTGQFFEATGLGWMEPLSQREMEVLHLIALGASNQDIAEKLVLTVGTVKSHINHLLRKLEARNRTEAVARARQLGWLDL